MDGTFDDDKTLLFTSNSNTLSFSNGLPISATTTDPSTLVYQYNKNTRNFDWYVHIPFAQSDASKLITGTPLYTTGNELKGEVIHSTVYRKYTGTTRVMNPEYTLPLAAPHRHLELTHQYLKVHLSVLERVLLVHQLWIWVRLYTSHLYTFGVHQ